MTCDRVTVLVLCTSFDVCLSVYSFISFPFIFSEICSGQAFYCKNTGDRVTVLAICNSPHGPLLPGRVVQSVGHLTRKSGVLGSIPGLETYFCFSFRFFKKGSCQLLLAKVCARSTG